MYAFVAAAALAVAIVSIAILLVFDPEFRSVVIRALMTGGGYIKVHDVPERW
jgi:hypothetical protein